MIPKGEELKKKLFFIILLFPSPTFCWWTVGHEIVAQIAHNMVKPEVRKKIDDISKSLDEYQPPESSFIQSAAWLDEIKQGTQAHLYATWHFKDKPYDPENILSQEAKESIEEQSKHANIVWALQNLKESFLQKKDMGKLEQMFNLRMLIHLVGDIHQPFHCVNRYSSQHPHGDKGGNLMHVTFNKEKINVHALWDDAFKQFSKIAHPPTADDLQKIKDVAQKLTQENNRSKMLESSTEFQDWLNDGYDIATNFGYVDIEEDKPICEEYEEMGKKITRVRLAYAGYHLADILNEIFADK